MFNHLPIPLIDIQVKSDGSFRKVPKTHDLRLANIQWLIDDNPEVLVISLGWSRVVKPRQEIYDFKGCKIHLLPNAEAIELFNTLQKEGKRVAIQYHSTC
ncbi:MAG: hypothetical protein ACKVQC_00875 [Elusimicrobiota bacterium]